MNIHNDSLRHRLLAGIVSAVLAAFGGAAHAAPAVTLTSPPSIGGVNGSNFMVGYRFQAEADLVVTALGAYDYGLDGIQGGAAVGLWTLDGTLLASATIPSGTSDSFLDGYFRYVDITAVTIDAGTQYVLGSLSSDPMGFFNANYGGVTLSTADEITLLRNRDLPLGSGGPHTLTFPSREPINTHLGSFGPNMQIEARAEVPEPQSLAMLMLGLGLAGLMRRRV